MKTDVIILILLLLLILGCSNLSSKEETRILNYSGIIDNVSYNITHQRLIKHFFYFDVEYNNFNNYTVYAQFLELENPNRKVKIQHLAGIVSTTGCFPSTLPPYGKIISKYRIYDEGMELFDKLNLTIKLDINESKNLCLG